MSYQPPTYHTNQQQYNPYIPQQQQQQQQQRQVRHPQYQNEEYHASPQHPFTGGPPPPLGHPSYYTPYTPQQQPQPLSSSSYDPYAQSSHRGGHFSEQYGGGAPPGHPYAYPAQQTNQPLHHYPTEELQHSYPSDDTHLAPRYTPQASASPVPSAQYPSNEITSPIPNHINLAQIQPQPTVPTSHIPLPPPDDTPTPVASSSALPLRIKIKRPVSAQPIEETMSRPKRASTVKVEQGYNAIPERPKRSNQGVQPARYRHNDDDEEEEEEFNPGAEEEDEPYAEDSEPEVIPTFSTSTRSGRTRKPVERFAGSIPNGNHHEEDGEEEPDALGEDDFEDTMHQTSPVAPAKSTKAKLQSLARAARGRAETQSEWEEHAGRRRSSGRLAFPSQVEVANGFDGGLPDSQEEIVRPSRSTRNTRAPKRAKSRNSSAGEESFAPDHSATGTESEGDSPSAHLPDEDDEDDDDEDDDGGWPPARRTSRPSRTTRQPTRRAPPAVTVRRSTRNSARTREASEDEEYGPTKKRQLRERAKVDYALPPLDISAELSTAVEAVSGPSRKGYGGNKRLGAAGWKSNPPWASRLNQVTMANNRDADSSDSDLDLLPPVRGSMGAGGSGGGQAAIGSGGGNMRTDVQNFGRVNPKSNMADADPLGVDVNVTFDNVGGLDGHINQLKEMVALPLLYPEVFQQFGITPPRGVLFHGPPGTGKTLLARALAASCSNGNTKIAFFMRKGADVLSKWVGEAERQLRMLFEEARASQPSIIFFDEIDGLAPVRSSKQDQIHASLVSTLLALMDGMDGRGQVIVIGATNRPDSVDPALRRPGRFDREFYFPLPNKEARKKIISINTRKWTPQLADDTLDQLAGLTKGYGGADLRALCTEAALNAVQRRYPQIYSSEDRLLLDPSSIVVGAKDFMMSVKKIVPSSARSSSSAALQLPPHLAPLLESPLERLKVAVDKILPRHKTKSALEEAMYEDEVGDDLERHAMIHSLDKMRTYRPRVLLHGSSGMGQGYLGPAILHHLEGFHVQSLDLGNLLGDSTRTSEAAIVQLFVEAKRHQPSVLFIPSLLPWSLALSETARTTFRALLDSVPSSDPVLLLAILDGEVNDLPKDVRRWFGIGKDGRVELDVPTPNERTTYFTSLIDTYRKPPTSFPDALPRRKRVLEILPIAPPLPPRPPTQFEIERDLEEDGKARQMMLFSFSGLWPDVEKKYGRVAANARVSAQELYQEWMDRIDLAKEAIAAERAAGITNDDEEHPLPNGDVNGHSPVVQPLLPSSSAPAILPTVEVPLPVVPSPLVQTVDFAQPPAGLDNLFDADSPIIVPTVLPEIIIHPTTSTANDTPHLALASDEIPSEPTWKPHDIDLARIQLRVSKHKYFAPQDFLDDILKIVENAKNAQEVPLILKTEELLAQIKLHVDTFDPNWLPRFERYKKRMVERKAEAVKRREAEAGKGKEKEDVVEVVVQELNTGLNVNAPAGLSGESGEGGLKRAREEEGADGERAGKRARDESMDIDQSIHPSITVESIPTASIPSMQQTGESSNTSSRLATTSVPIPSVPAPRQATPPPPPVYPPFICPIDDMNKLSAELRLRTDKLNVDQLEQLRAGLYDLIWRSRAEWDRRDVLGKAIEKVKEFVQEVDEMEDD